MLQYSFQNTSFSYEVSILDSFETEERICIEKQNEEIQGINYQIERSKLIQEIENEFLSFIRVGDIIHFSDTLFLSQNLADNIDKLLKFFNTLSDNMAFSYPCWYLSHRLISIGNKRLVTQDMPIWFLPKKKYSLGSWIVCIFERAIWLEFFISILKLPFEKIPLFNEKQFYVAQKYLSLETNEIKKVLLSDK